MKKVFRLITWVEGVVFRVSLETTMRIAVLGMIFTLFCLVLVLQTPAGSFGGVVR